MTRRTSTTPTRAAVYQPGFHRADLAQYEVRRDVPEGIRPAGKGASRTGRLIMLLDPTSFASGIGLPPPEWMHFAPISDIEFDKI